MNAASPGIRVVIPIFDDWISLARLLDELERELAASGLSADVLIVDDASTQPISALEHVPRNGALHRIEVLRLRRNLGHQRAIAIALAYVESTDPPDYVAVMDGDGEDRPADVPALLRAAEGQSDVVFAERRRRSEGPLFATLYHGYRALHWALTGVSVRVGNFSVIPRSSLQRVVGVGDLWNHYAAAVFKSRIPYRTIATARGARYSGGSQMSYAALVSHGLSAMAAFGDRIGIRLLGATFILAIGVAITTLAVLARNWPATSGLMPFVVAVTALLLFQTLAVTLTFVFVILGRRDTDTFLPLRDFQPYVLDCQPLSAAIDGRISLRR